MKKLIYLAVFAFTLQLAQAEDLTFAHEGDAAKRERLEGLQGSKTPPAWTLSDWANSKELTLNSLKGKIIVVDFWATWCGPCIGAIPHSNEIHEKYKNDVVFIGVCHPEGSETMGKVVKEKGIKYPVAIDKNGEMIKAYKVNGYPDYYIFDKTGALVVADCANAQVEKVIKALLKNEAGSGRSITSSK